MRKNFNNLTLILGSYKCNKNCPYCIAKNNMKFANFDDKIDDLDNIMNDLIKANVYFQKFVLSGNGEPSLYDLNTLKRIKEILVKNRNLFGSLRIHSSGNIFFEDEKFVLFNDKYLKPEFEILRVAIDYDKDKSILGYNRNYLDANCFKKALNVKCDIAFTDYLEDNNLVRDLSNLLSFNHQISTVRFKKLMPGDSINTKQAKWVINHTLSDSKINDLFSKVKHGVGNYTSIVYDVTGNYNYDYVINCGQLQDYNYNKLTVHELVKRRKLNE